MKHVKYAHIITIVDDRCQYAPRCLVCDAYLCVGLWANQLDSFTYGNVFDGSYICRECFEVSVDDIWYGNTSKTELAGAIAIYNNVFADIFDIREYLRLVKSKSI